MAFTPHTQLPTDSTELLDFLLGNTHSDLSWLNNVSTTGAMTSTTIEINGREVEVTVGGGEVRSMDGELLWSDSKGYDENDPTYHGWSWTGMD